MVVSGCEWFGLSSLPIPTPHPDPSTIRPAILAADPDRHPFVDSSPSNEILSEDPYVKRWGDVGAWSWGDVHYYHYDADCEDPSTYPQTRFISEHGFQSCASFSRTWPEPDPHLKDPHLKDPHPKDPRMKDPRPNWGVLFLDMETAGSPS